MLLTLTPEAKLHFTDLISNYINNSNSKAKLNIRLKAIDAGTNKASVDLSYCPEGEQDPSDIIIDYYNFVLYVEKNSAFALKDAVIDYKYSYDQNEQKLSKYGKLHIKAPFLKSCNEPNPLVNLDLFNRVKNFLNQKINPTLAKHKGMVELLAVSDNNKEVILQFSGGCKGCSIVGITLKNVIEKSLKAEFPEIILIKDATDHATL